MIILLDCLWCRGLVWTRHITDASLSWRRQCPIYLPPWFSVRVAPVSRLPGRPEDLDGIGDERPEPPCAGREVRLIGHMEGGQPMHHRQQQIARPVGLEMRGDGARRDDLGEDLAPRRTQGV